MDAAVALKTLRSEEGRKDPYPCYAALHRHGPVYAPPGGEPYTLVAHGYDVVNQVLRDPVFRVADAAYMDEISTAWRKNPTWLTLTKSMMFVNAPDHSRMRGLVSQALSPRRVASLEPAIIGLIDNLLDRMAELGTGGAALDFMAEFAFRLPIDVMGELLGVPAADRAWFRPRVEAIGAAIDIGGGDAARMAISNTSVGELRAYFAELAEQRRRAPREDLVTSLVQASGGGADRLTEDELLANLIVLFNAGFVTTTHLFGNGLALFLRQPEHAARLRERPELAAAYVEEILRYEASVQILIRFAGEDTEVAGVPVPRRGKVLLLPAAANRDPRRYHNPEVFDPARPDIQPLSFGAGPHFCLGAALSRREGQLAFPRLVERFPRIAPAGEPTRSDQLNLSGYQILPVTVG